jgi:hypothetical protein
MKPPPKKSPGRPKQLQSKERRIQLSVSVRRETADWFEAQDEPAGRIIERLLEKQLGEQK